MSNDTMTQQADKIAKLLAKAEGASTEAEAAAFFEAAERLMMKWGIDELMLRSRTGARSDDVVERRDFEWKGSSVDTTWVQDCLLMFEIAKHHGMQMLMNKPMRTFVLIGWHSDYDRAVQTFTTLVLQMNRFASAEWKEVPQEHKRMMGQYDKRVWQRSFRQGFTDRIAARLREVRREVQKEAEAEHGDGMSLVLRDRKKAVDDFFDNMAKGKGRASRSRTNQSARAAGTAAASRADMGQTRMGQGARAALGR